MPDVDYALTSSERRRLLSVAARVVGYNDAEDVVQEALLRAYLYRDKYAPDGPWFHWLYIITANTARNVRHAKNVRPLNERVVPLARAESLSYTMEARLLRRRLVAALRCVPTLYQRRALFVSLTTDSYRDAAEQAGCSVAVYKQRLFRARTIFKQHWQKAEV